MKLIDLEELKAKQKRITDKDGQEHFVIEAADINKIQSFDLSQLIPLEPCPSCSSKAKVIHKKASEVYGKPIDKYDDLWSVECTNCSMRTGEYTYSPYRAIETWNRRTQR